jgi:uncharacterized membrane protein YdjX (TVP38/TMEM64 family)
MALRRNLQRHLLIIGLLIVVAGLITASDTLHGRTEAMILWTENLIAQAPFLGMLAFLLLAMLSAMVAFFSSALLAPIAIYAWGKTACFALLWGGWFLGRLKYLATCLAYSATASCSTWRRSESLNYLMQSPRFISGSPF